MPVLYGVFLFMGTSSLKGIQLVQRVLIMFMPAKYQPDYVYLRHVPLGRCHLFTFVQVLCLAALWTIKSIPSISIIFPLMVRSSSDVTLTSYARSNFCECGACCRCWRCASFANSSTTSSRVTSCAGWTIFCLNRTRRRRRTRRRGRMLTR